MTRRERRFTKSREISTLHFEKKVFLHDSNGRIKVAVFLLVNMSQGSHESLRLSRIKFKSFTTKGTNSREGLRSEISSFNGSRVHTSGDDSTVLLDPTICYHPKCSFAYNITSENLAKPSLIAECMPLSTYKRLANLWGLDPDKTPRPYGNKCQQLDAEEEDQTVEEFIRSVERDLGIRSDISEDLQVNADSTKEVKGGKIRLFEMKENPYLKFLKKDGDYDGERREKANLRRKAKKITKTIIKNFLDWYQSLGGNDNETLLDDSTLQELFQIGFDLPEAKALAIRIKELPTVPECLALLRNEPKHATRFGLREILKQDIRREQIPLKMFAFGNMLPKESPPLRYKPPRNFVKKTWLECSRVPSELDTMKTIWVGLEKLRSTVAFSNWLKNHPHIRPPTFLQQKGLLAINYEEWSQMYKGFEMEVNAVESVPSYWKIDREKESSQGVGLREASLEKSESLISY